MGKIAYTFSRSARRQLIGRNSGDRLSLVEHAPLPNVNQANDALERRALADAVAAEQADDLASLHRQADAAQDVALPVIGVEVLDLHQRIAGWRRHAHILR
jgi:hypothetical protein